MRKVGFLRCLRDVSLSPLIRHLSWECAESVTELPFLLLAEVSAPQLSKGQWVLGLQL